MCHDRCRQEDITGTSTVRQTWAQLSSYLKQSWGPVRQGGESGWVTAGGAAAPQALGSLHHSGPHGGAWAQGRTAAGVKAAAGAGMRQSRYCSAGNVASLLCQGVCDYSVPAWSFEQQRTTAGVTVLAVPCRPSEHQQLDIAAFIVPVVPCKHFMQASSCRHLTET
jgi:hypothetical protein